MSDDLKRSGARVPMEHCTSAIVCARPKDFDLVFGRCLEARDYRLAVPGESSERLDVSGYGDQLALHNPLGGRVLSELVDVLAKELASDVRLYEVRVRETEDGEQEERQVSRSSFVISGSGTREPLVHETCLEVLSGDFPEAANHVMSEWLNDEVRSAEFEDLGLRAVVRQSSPLSARLQDLVRQIRDAGAFSASESNGRFTLRIALPDGSRRVSFLSEDELALVDAACPGLKKS